VGRIDLHALRQQMLHFIRRGMKRHPGAPTFSVILVLLAALVAYWGYGEHRKRELPRTVSALVQDASLRLQDALKGEGDALDAHPDVLRRLDQHVIAVSAHLSKLRATDTAAIEAFANAADDYLLTAREILRRRAAEYRYRMALSDSTRALREHMRFDNHTGTWITEAVRMRNRMEADYRDYRLTTEALAKLLELFSESRARLVPYADRAVLADEKAVSAARGRALETYGKKTADVERVGQLNAYR
jgi:hypothetical protein